MYSNATACSVVGNRYMYFLDMPGFRLTALKNQWKYNDDTTLLTIRRGPSWGHACPLLVLLMQAPIMGIQPATTALLPSSLKRRYHILETLIGLKSLELSGLGTLLEVSASCRIWAPNDIETGSRVKHSTGPYKHRLLQPRAVGSGKNCGHPCFPFSTATLSL